MAKRRVPELGERDVLIEDIGPIERLEFTAAPGTITVLRGCNGVGKSQALGAVDALVNGRSRLTGRDGTTGGTARGFGVKIAVGRGGANRRSGELVVESIEDRLNIADLVDPGLKDPFAADARRIRALVQLSGVKASLDLFSDLLNADQLREIVPPTVAELDDVVAMADALKRSIEAKARARENEAENLTREAAAKRATTEGIDLTAPSDEATLSAGLQDTLQTWSRLRAQREAGLAAQAQRSLDVARLADLRAERGDGPSGPDLIAQEDAARSTLIHASRRVTELRDQLRQAEADERVAKEVLSAAVAALESGRREAAAIAALQATCESPLPETPTEAAVTAAAARYDYAKAAMTTGVRVRDALGRMLQAEAIEEKAAEASAAAEELRDAAKGTGDVLSRIVSAMGGAFVVDKEFRLVVPGTERGAEYFAELSHGERWRLALLVAINAFQRTERPGLLAIPQECFEGLDGRSRRIIAETIRDTNLSVITAEADHSENPSDEIVVETYEVAHAAAY